MHGQQTPIGGENDRKKSENTPLIPSCGDGLVAPPTDLISCEL